MKIPNSSDIITHKSFRTWKRDIRIFSACGCTSSFNRAYCRFFSCIEMDGSIRRYAFSVEGLVNRKQEIISNRDLVLKFTLDHSAAVQLESFSPTSPTPSPTFHRHSPIISLTQFSIRLSHITHQLILNYLTRWSSKIGDGFGYKQRMNMRLNSRWFSDISSINSPEIELLRTLSICSKSVDVRYCCFIRIREISRFEVTVIRLNVIYLRRMNLLFRLDDDYFQCSLCNNVL